MQSKGGREGERKKEGGREREGKALITINSLAIECLEAKIYGNFTIAVYSYLE